MKNDIFSIYIDRLRDGKEEELHVTTSSQEIGVTIEDDTRILDVECSGTAYLSSDYLILSLAISYAFNATCRKCNELSKEKRELPMQSYTLLLESIRGSVYNYNSVIREAILLDIPEYTECREENLAQCNEILAYIK